MIYAPQENKCKLQEVEDSFRNIKDEVRKAEINGEKVLIMGDFNCKIGSIVTGNEEKISKTGKVLMKMCNDMELSILNAHEKCVGKWTRIENDKKSILDYGLIRREDQEAITRVEIDENKIFTPFRITKDITYTDHCAIIVDINWKLVSNNSDLKNRRILNLIMFNKETEEAGLKAVAEEKTDLKVKYTKWQSKVNKIIEKCERKVSSNKKQTKVVRRLMKVKRSIKKKRRSEMDMKRKRLLKLQESLIDRYIVGENAREQGEKVKKTADRIKQKGGINSTALWEFKKQMDGPKVNKMYAIKNKEGNTIDNVKDIKKEFETVYTNLFKKQEAKNEDEKIKEKINSIVIKLLQNKKIKGCKLKKSSMGDIERVVNQLKNKNTKDRDMMSNKMLKTMGKDMKESLKILINEVEEQVITPNEWNRMGIVSISKARGDKHSLENRRGLFITNTISKIFEKLRLETMNEEIEDKMSRFQ